ncbi:MAG TPA: HPF/RaiA family ribosome-associated protein [Opitutaceae bacterium]|nr:HPF/RaiA family ribosome-associated protein [Opitutaceae bacterium]
MNTSSPKILLSTEGFLTSLDLIDYADGKAAKLLRHEHPRVHLVRLHLKRETPHSGAPHFSARATAEHAGPDHVVHASGSHPEAAINAAVDKLERALTGAAGAARHLKHHPHPVELAVDLPKAAGGGGGA